jgi:hypothetical protein
MNVDVINVIFFVKEKEKCSMSLIRVKKYGTGQNNFSCTIFNFKTISRN